MAKKPKIDLIDQIEDPTDTSPLPMASDTWLHAAAASGFPTPLLPTPGPKPDAALEPEPVRRRPRHRDQKGRKFGELDAEVSEDDWRMVYKEYGNTASIREISARTGITYQKVNHVLRHGVNRLGLPPIKEHAIDNAAVNIRLRDVLQASKQNTNNRGLVIQEVQEAVTDRAAREAASAQSLLGSAMKTAEVMLKYVDEVVKAVHDPARGFLLPDKIPLGTLDTLAKAINQLSGAVDKAVRLSRFTAGEPEHHLSFEVYAAISRLPNEDLQFYLRTGRLPKQIVIGTIPNFVDAGLGQLGEASASLLGPSEQDAGQDRYTEAGDRNGAADKAEAAHAGNPDADPGPDTSTGT